VLLTYGLQVLVDGDEESPRLQLLSASELAPAALRDSTFLGCDDGTALFAVDTPDPEPPSGRFVELRSVGTMLPRHEAGLAAYARGLAHWRIRHKHCGACGVANTFEQAGHAALCAACGNQTFPRTDPAVIVLVTHGQRCLLGRASRFPPGMYSTLAGFVEPGESLEETLCREIWEEAGIAITDVAYRSSQPWPFPQSLMLGFRARALDEALRVDPEELEDARWFDRALLIDPERRPVRLPSTDSIARFLIDEWLAEES
jgi:NAD+ diphosphatase